MNKLKRIWRILRGNDLEDRALSYACAVLEVLEGETQWTSQTVMLIAREAVERNLAIVVDDRLFHRHDDAFMLARQVKRTQSVQ